MTSFLANDQKRAMCLFVLISRPSFPFSWRGINRIKPKWKAKKLRVKFNIDKKTHKSSMGAWCMTQIILVNQGVSLYNCPLNYPANQSNLWGFGLASNKSKNQPLNRFAPFHGVCTSLCAGLKKSRSQIRPIHQTSLQKQFVGSFTLYGVISHKAKRKTIPWLLLVSFSSS